MLTPESATRKDKTSGLGEMQHRHFATVAAIIRSYHPETVASEADAIAEHFANELARTNPKFDRARFLRACAD